MYTLLPTTKRPASEVLAEYLAALRNTTAYRHVRFDRASALVNEITAATVWTPPRDGWDSPQPQNLPNGDRIWGTSYRGVYTVEFATNSSLQYQDYNVHHTLYPDGRGSVWLGVANNSARFDCDGYVALRLWHARFALQRVPAWEQLSFDFDIQPEENNR